MRLFPCLFQVAKFNLSQVNIANKGTNNLPPLPTVSQLVKLYKVRAAKQLSQNFLYDPRIVGRLVSCSKPNLDGYHVCEVGPGPGALTRDILSKDAESLTVVEKDERFLPILRYIADIAKGRMSIVHGDILKYDITDAFPRELAKSWASDPPPFFIIGNLPFNVSLPLLFQWLSQIYKKRGPFQLGRIPLTLTFQKEVGERLSAQPKNAQRCRLSVTTQYLCDVQYRFEISGKSFIPKAKVDVAVVKLIPKVEPQIDLPFNTVDYVVKHTMHRKKKSCKLGVSTLFPKKRDDLVNEMFQISGVSDGIWPIDLTNEQFRDLCYAYEEIANKIPQLRLVDSYDPNVWAKYFNSNGDPLINI